MKRRTLGSRALTCGGKCNAVVAVRRYHQCGEWYLSTSSHLVHANHQRIDPRHKRIRENDLSELDTDLAQLMHEEGASLDCLTRVMNKLRTRKGLVGELRKKTLRNLIAKNKLNIEFIENVDRNWSVAQKTIETLKRRNISYVALVMDQNDNLLVYKGKGRHSEAEMKTINTHGDLRPLLRKLRSELKLEDTNHVLLALSVATDNMIRTMHMFPEVQFIDVGANFNAQNRDILFCVVKSATGQSFIVNVTVMPCGQRWIFLKIYQTFFVYLYGSVAISRIELVLTDNDASSHGAISDAEILEPCWKGVRIMLCVFHGLVMAMHKDVYPKLPHKSDNSHELTKIGKLYCESHVNFFLTP